MLDAMRIAMTSAWTVLLAVALLAPAVALAQPAPPSPVFMRLVLPGIAVDGGAATGETALAAAEREWGARGPRSYRLSYTVSGYPFVYAFESVVNSGIAAEVSRRCTIANIEEVPCPAGSAVLTVEGLFALIRAAYEGGAVEGVPGTMGLRYIVVSYGEMGVPVRIETGLSGVPDSVLVRTAAVEPLP